MSKNRSLLASFTLLFGVLVTYSSSSVAQSDALDDGLLAYWPFDECAGWDYNPTSVNGNNLEFVGPITCVNSLDGRAVSLDNTQVGVDPDTDPEVICAAIGCGDYAGLLAERDAAEAAAIAATANAAAAQAAWDARQDYYGTVVYNLTVYQVTYSTFLAASDSRAAEVTAAQAAVDAAQAAYDTAQAAYNADPREANETARDDAENALSDAQAALTQLEALLAQAIEDTEGAAAGLAAAQAEFDAAQQESMQLQADLDAANQALAAANAALAEAIVNFSVVEDAVSNALTAKYLLTESDIKLDSPSYAISVWVNIAEYSGDWAPIISRQLNNAEFTEDAWSLTVRNNGQLYFWLSDPSQRSEICCQIPTQEWVHIAVSVDSGVGTIYVNGNAVDTFSASTISSSDDVRVCVGCNDYTQYSPPAHLFNGQLDELRVYERALSSNDVVALSTSERDVLVSFYNATDGDNWANSDFWLSDEPHCSWSGVGCNGQGQVTSLYRDYNRLVGSIPAELATLENLQFLSLRANQLSGSIPSELGNLSSLNTLLLHNNALSGAIPAELGNLVNMNQLNLSGNQLSGSIPAELGNLQYAQEINLGNNQLSGNLPAELANLANLRALSLSGNQLTGAVGDWLTTLTSLNRIFLQDNEFDGPVTSLVADFLADRSFLMDANLFPCEAPCYPDSDNDGIGDNIDSDRDGDFVPNQIELDSGSNPDNSDSDGDGVSDSFDAFPLDADETLDSDGDGIGNSVDTDDDNDGIADTDDFFPLAPYLGTTVDSDLTIEALPFGIVQYHPGVAEQPTIRIGAGTMAFELASDGTYKGFRHYYSTQGNGERGRRVDHYGVWEKSGDGYVLTSTSEYRSRRSVACGNDQVGSNQVAASNINCASLANSEQGFITYDNIEVRRYFTYRLAKVASTEDRWVLARQFSEEDYAVNPENAIDPNLPVYSSWPADPVDEWEILAPGTDFVAFTEDELIGTWTFGGLNEDDFSLANHCPPSENQCADLIAFYGNGTAYLELSGRSAIWSINTSGAVELTFIDNNTEMTLERLSKGSEASTTLVRFDSGAGYHAEVELMVKRDPEASSDISQFYGQLMSSAFYVTYDSRLERSLFPPSGYRRSSIDDGLIDNFGFIVNSDSTGTRFDSSRVDLNRQYCELYFVCSFFNFDISWTQIDNRITSTYCLYATDQYFDKCQLAQLRVWDLMKVTDDRFYVLETLIDIYDLGTPNERIAGSSSRPNFYERTPYYDVDDFDRDGYSNDIDTFQFDELEWDDLDGNGVGDNSEGDTDGDGVINSEDAFPEDPAASLDSDGDGAPDSWNADATEEQLAATTLVLDALPFDANETIDTDGDGIGNNSDNDDDGDSLADDTEVEIGTDPLRVDTDGDGTGDGIDRFPLDTLEHMDLDNDGIGDNADFDDDADSIIDRLDVFPRQDFGTPLIGADLSSATIPHGLVEFRPSAVDDPWAAEGWLHRAWILEPDGSYRANTAHAGQAGTWQAVGNGYRLDRTTDRYFNDNTRWLDPMQHLNIDWDYVSTTVTTGDSSSGLDFEVREVLETRLAVIESDNDSMTLAITDTWRRYALDPNVVLDPDLPIQVFESNVFEREVLSSDINSVAFTAIELLGTWVVEGLNEDDYNLAERCTFSGDYRIYRSQCSDHITFSANSTAVLEHSGRTAVWAIADDGSVTLDFDDNGTRFVLRRIAQGDDTSSVLVSFETEDEYYAQVNMMIKPSVPRPESLANFIDQGFVMNSFGVTNDQYQYRRSLTDGGYIGGFGFKLNSDGTGGRYDINNSVSTLDSGRDVITGSLNELPITWTQDGNTITSYACLIPFYEGGPCYREQVRIWELVKTTASRFYVNETLSWRLDYQGDGVVDEEIAAVSRPNFYELAPFYDTNDLDRDGYPNDIDAFPTDERQFQDADGDGIGDNPLLPGDIDGDGITDDSDAFPLDAEESADNDADGVGDNRDTDDDNDGISDIDEISAGTDPLDASSYPGEESARGIPLWFKLIAIDRDLDGGPDSNP